MGNNATQLRHFEKIDDPLEKSAAADAAKFGLLGSGLKGTKRYTSNLNVQQSI